ncbi:hypothetical protein M3Y99_01353800 [Aphelenchoides fujianensis]|nr:hypothetical protein M3Y99_01353800 [Aphelenchoides fujianensis]
MSARRSRSGGSGVVRGGGAEVFDLRGSSPNIRNASPAVELPEADVPEIYAVNSRPKKRSTRRRKSDKTRCSDPNCEICAAFEDEKARVVVEQPAVGDAAQLAAQNAPIASLTQVGLDAQRYRFYRKTPQLDAAIGIVTQLLDERLQAERYRDAAELRRILLELLEKRREADRLLLNRRQSLKAGDLEGAQALKNTYDQLTSTAVDFRKLRPYMDEKQHAALAALRRF